MNFTQSFEMAIKSIFSNKVRSVLTMLGIIIGVSAVIIMVSVVEGQNKMWMEYMEQSGTNRINVNAYTRDGRNNPEMAEIIRKYVADNPDLYIGFTPQGQTNTKVKYMKNNINTLVQFGNEDFDICNKWEVKEGRAITYNDVKNRSKVAVLGAKTKKKLFNYQSAIGKTVSLQGEEFTVIGTYVAKKEDTGEEENNMMSWNQPDEFILVPYTTQRTVMKAENINTYTIKAASSAAAKEGTPKLRSYLEKFKGNGDLYVDSEQEWMDQNNEQTIIMSLVAGGIAGISLIVGGIGIMNIMLVSVSERTREIGIRKAIGANRPVIVTQFLIEAATLSALGGVIGIILGIMGSLIAGKFLLKAVLFPSPFIMIFAFSFSVFLGVFFGFYPANKASKMNPIDALRSE